MALEKFELSAEDSAELRRLGEAGDDTRPTWERAAEQLKFDPTTVQQIKTAGDKPVTFKAEPAELTLDEAVANLSESVARATEAEPEPVYDLSEGAHDAAVARMEAVADQFTPKPGTLVFDVRDIILTHIKQMAKPWTGCSQDQQQDIAAAAEETAINVVRRMAEMMASEGKVGIPVLLMKVDLGDDIKITGKVKTFSGEATDDAVMALHHARGKNVMLIPASVDDYRQGERPAETIADQPEMSFDADHPADDADLAAGADDLDEGGGENTQA